MHEAGYAAVGWPAEYGGGGADEWQELIFEEYERVNGPVRLNRMALNLAGPTIMVHGTPDQKSRWLPGMLSVDPG